MAAFQSTLPSSSQSQSQASHHTLACLPILKANTVRAGAAHALPAAAGCVSVAPEAGRCDAATVRAGGTPSRGEQAASLTSAHLVVAIHPPSCRLVSVRARPPGRFRVSDTHLAVASPILAIVVVATSFSSRSSARALIHASLRHRARARARARASYLIHLPPRPSACS